MSCHWSVRPSDPCRSNQMMTGASVLHKWPWHCPYIPKAIRARTRETCPKSKLQSSFNLPHAKCAGTKRPGNADGRELFCVLLHGSQNGWDGPLKGTKAFYKASLSNQGLVLVTQVWFVTEAVWTTGQENTLVSLICSALTQAACIMSSFGKRIRSGIPVGLRAEPQNLVGHRIADNTSRLDAIILQSTQMYWLCAML